ncbi:MOSC N-terminal beta barrel domain-containing protein [Vibrio mediterranei]|uniref:MOSC N-terminal beta barrel domain-containing protein n=1 Tax=Vibrio barjaei TaxID=1676683 RepID=A0ABW7IBY1_9VIBR
MTFVTRLYHYPLKSGAPSRLKYALGDSSGFYNDRDFAIIKKQTNGLYSIRDNPSLSEIRLHYTSNKLSITFNREETNFTCDFEDQKTITMWSRNVTVNVANDPVSDFLSEILGEQVILVKGTERQNVQQTLMDTGPLHMVFEDEIESLRRECNVRSIDPLVFRPNILVSKSFLSEKELHQEININGFRFKVMERTERCSAVSLLYKKLTSKNYSPLVEVLNRTNHYKGAYFGVYLQPLSDFLINQSDVISLE